MHEPVPIPIEQQAEPTKKRHLNVVLIGHADSGKSTIGGQILCLTNQVDHENPLENMEIAVANNRESSYLANMMVPKESETQYYPQVGRVFFETESNRFTVLDAPGCKSSENLMISGLIQADICVLVISARRGEIDRAFYEDFWLPFPASGKIISEEQKDKFRKEILGQTLEHVEVAKNLGVSKLIIAVNKMDDPTINWSQDRYNQIKQKMVGFLELTGYNTEEDVVFLPMSGLHGINMDKRMHQNVCDWWGDRPYFFEALDSIEVPWRDANGPFRMLITGICEPENEKTVIIGKVESGSIRVDDDLVIMPIKVHVKVCAIYYNGNKVTQGELLETLHVWITRVQEDHISPGSVLSSTENHVPIVDQFIANLIIDKRLSMPYHVMSGHESVICMNGFFGDCFIQKILKVRDPKTKKYMKVKPILRTGDVAMCLIKVDKLMCVELGRRFILREEDGKPVAAGKVIRL